MRVLCLLDNAVNPQDRWIWDYLPDATPLDKVDFLYVTPHDLSSSWQRFISYYPFYWLLAFKAIIKCFQNNYDVIIAWESKNGLPLAILRGLLGIHRPKFVVLAFTFKNIALKCPWLGQIAMRGIDHLTVVATDEMFLYQQQLNLSLEKISFVPIGYYDLATTIESTVTKMQPYIFAGGRTFRDYKTLFKAVVDLELTLITATRPFVVQELDIPPNVNLYYEAGYSKLMVEADFAILPLIETPVAAGMGHIVELMSYGKAIIATRTTSTKDYIEDGQTGILVSPYDVEEMRSAIVYLSTHPEIVKNMGRRAREKYEEKFSFTAFARQNYEVIKKVVDAEV